jgi:hypothetical protein
MMACRERQSALQEYLAGELAPHDARELEAHLARCPACERDLEAYGLLGRALQRMPEPPVPETLHAELMAALRPKVVRWHVERESRLHTVLWRAGAIALTAAFGVSLSVALWGWMGRIGSFAAERFTRDLASFWSYLQDLWSFVRLVGDIVRTLQPTLDGLWSLVQRWGEPATAWGPTVLTAYGATLALGTWLCWRALRPRDERGIHHAA